ncbi:MAG: NUDIX hydrolase [Cyanobacteria bacterium J06626_6]
MTTPLINVALAILHRENHFLMQLRDDIPSIVFPGQWGFFGGHIEPGESAEEGVFRELMEEIGYRPEKLTLFYEQTDERVRRYCFYGELLVPVETLQLNEGQDIGLCSVAELTAGKKRSEKLSEVRSLGKPHQQILLKFLESGLLQS